MASTFSTWEYYHDTYNGKLSEGEYRRMAIQAAAEIDLRTLGRAQEAPAEMAAALQNCECELVDAMHGFDEAHEILPVGIQSINNDGYSVSAGSSNAAGAATSRLQSEDTVLRAICIKYLTRPVNLMYLGVRRRC